MGQGYIDQILFTQGNNALLSQANDYRNEIEALNRSQSLDCLKYIRQLKDKNIPVFFEKEAINTMDAKG